MARGSPHDYEQRVRALKKRLTLDFQPLRDTLARGLDVLIDPEAAVLCTATVEALCDALFTVVVKHLHDEAASSSAALDTKVTVYHLQLALRSHADFARLLQGVESATAVLEFFLDDHASRALYERRLLATREAKHLRPSQTSSSAPVPELLSDDQLIALHERTQSEWQKREDDPFTDVDFAMVLKCVHPAFTLAKSATLLLSALVRELLNEVCDRADVGRAQTRVPPELYVDDLHAPLASVFHVGGSGRQIGRTASECLERFRLRSRQGASLTLRFRVFSRSHNASASAKAAGYALPPVARDAPFAALLVQMCKKCHLDPVATVGVYRGHQLEATATPGALSMPTGAVVYLVPKQWWDHTRRNEARRGLLSSLRPQDAHVKSLVQSSASRVKKELAAEAEAAAMSAAHRQKDKPVRLAKDRTKMPVKSVHAASASRLVSVRGGGGGGGGAERTPRSDGEDPEVDEDESGSQAGQSEDDDSLARLLRRRQRQRLRHGKSVNKAVPPADAPPTRQAAAVERRALVRTLATQSTQLVDALDEAWLGFAGISVGVRSMNETLRRQTADQEEWMEDEEEEDPLDVDHLERELRNRLEKTSELVRQTTVAHELVAQLLRGTQQLRRGADPFSTHDAERRGGEAM